MIESTVQDACNVFADILVASNITNCVLSAGSRNAPLIMALARRKEIRTIVIEDERTAAFVGLGMAQRGSKPVAIVCTSGSALLNYTPAIAEAYYQKVPLLVVSADRPEEWIDQDDCQTIKQNGVLEKIVKKTFDIPSRYSDEDSKWYVNRMLNDAVLSCTDAPIHINFHFAEPLYASHLYEENSARVIKKMSPTYQLPKSLIQEYQKAKRVMFVVGFGDYSKLAISNLQQLARKQNTVILTETIANIHGVEIIRSIDRIISVATDEDWESLCPDLLITMGGSWLSRKLKSKLRQMNINQHWHVGKCDDIIDVTKQLTHHIDCHPETFLMHINDSTEECNSNYSTSWQESYLKATASHNELVNSAPWSDMKVFNTLFSLLPNDCELQFSNGTPIRYAQLFGNDITVRTNCNRGVSGIDGCTSTALGASLISNQQTILITGDMSFCYDLGALGCSIKNPKFKIIVIDNGGGGIFRFIQGPTTLPELEDYFVVKRERNIKGIAQAFDYRFFEASDEQSLNIKMSEFLQCNHCAVLSIKTPAEINANILRKYFSRNN